MEHCDVLVVGGGPAGSSLAWGLRDSGLEVVILDKKTFPRDKVCAGWITPSVIEALSLESADYRQGRVFQPIHGFRVSPLGGKEVETYYQGEPISYGIRRCEFDHYLLQRSGARLRLGEPLKEMRREDDAWVIDGAIRTPLVVGAGGHFCPVARLMGARLGRTEVIVAAQEVEFALSNTQSTQCRVREDIPELFFCEDLRGYAWVFRKNGYLNVGLGREDNHRLAEHVAEVCAFLKARGRIPQDTPDAFKGHAYLLYHHAPRTLVADGLMLIGDAAGLAYPQSGEGIRPAVESGLLAAAAIREARGDYRERALSRYREQILHRFGERESTPGFSERIPAPLKRFLAQTLLSRHWFVRHIVMDRWFLHTQQPPLTATRDGQAAYTS